jgi:polyribonucleotide nucleotidyltransferase
VEATLILCKEIEIGSGTLTIETGRLAKQADGSVVVRYGDTVVLVTAVASKTPREGVDFLPLTVDYRENTYAAGKIPGGFFRREGRPNEKEVLTSRVIDRPLRPLFPEGWTFETQIIGLLLSSDQKNDSDVLAITGASCALAISDIPFPGPIAAVRVGLSPEGSYLINPTFQELETSRLNLIVAGSDQAVVMVEAGATEVSEEAVLEGIYRGHQEIRRLVALQVEMAAEVGRKKRTVPRLPEPEGLHDRLRQQWKAPLAAAMRVRGKLASYGQVDEVKERMLSQLGEDDPEARSCAKRFWGELQDEILREEVLERGVRLDGRRFSEIRGIDCQVGVLPRTHGSALFTRGETQALATVTLGTSADAQRLDWVEGESTRRFMLHYNFPPFSVGEARFLRGPGRREIGHGALGERSLAVMIPPEDKWPYTIRIVSDILESNGSSSMATVCGGSLALMDAGVPLTTPVAGIAMGLVAGHDRFEVLTDIAGAEDHHGDMDFKVAGTAKGITGLQMDIKVSGIPRDVMSRALAQAREARLAILSKMNEALSAPRAAISPYAPRIISIYIDRDKIRDVIGPGGKMIRSITERTGCKIEIQDDGRVDIASTDESAAQQAVDIIKELTAEAELGKIYLGKVVRVVNFGAFVEILPGVEGLLHISEIEDRRIEEVRDVLEEGDETMVKVIDIDANRRVRLSRRAALRESEGGAHGSGDEGEGRERDVEPVGVAEERPRRGGPGGGSGGGPGGSGRPRGRGRRGPGGSGGSGGRGGDLGGGPRRDRQH